MTGQRGVALILVVLVTTFLSALGIGLMLSVYMDRLANGNLSGSVAMLFAADAGIELAAREADGNPAVDAPGDAQPGHGIVRVRAEAYGVAGSRRALEAELVRVCPDGPGQPCLPGIRVQSWQELRQAVP